MNPLIRRPLTTITLAVAGHQRKCLFDTLLCRGQGLIKPRGTSHSVRHTSFRILGPDKRFASTHVTNQDGGAQESSVKLSYSSPAEPPPTTISPSQPVTDESTKIGCGSSNDSIDKDDEEDEVEQEEMFVTPHESFEFTGREWGGPTRGGRFPEPTRYGDWERKGRCSDF
jgi:hypothetical protein